MYPAAREGPILLIVLLEGIFLPVVFLRTSAPSLGGRAAGARFTITHYPSETTVVWRDEIK
jgi:hypothetical protein